MEIPAQHSSPTLSFNLLGLAFISSFHKPFVWWGTKRGSRKGLTVYIVMVSVLPNGVISHWPPKLTASTPSADSRQALSSNIIETKRDPLVTYIYWSGCWTQALYVSNAHWLPVTVPTVCSQSDLPLEIMLDWRISTRQLRFSPNKLAATNPVPSHLARPWWALICFNQQSLHWRESGTETFSSWVPLGFHPLVWVLHVYLIFWTFLVALEPRSIAVQVHLVFHLKSEVLL